MEMFWFFQLWFCWAYELAYDSDFQLLQGHKLRHDYNYYYDSIASESQP